METNGVWVHASRKAEFFGLSASSFFYLLLLALFWSIPMLVIVSALIVVDSVLRKWLKLSMATALQALLRAVLGNIIPRHQ